MKNEVSALCHRVDEKEKVNLQLMTVYYNNCCTAYLMSVVPHLTKIGRREENSSIVLLSSVRSGVLPGVL